MLKAKKLYIHNIVIIISQPKENIIIVAWADLVRILDERQLMTYLRLITASFDGHAPLHGGTEINWNIHVLH